MKKLVENMDPQLDQKIGPIKWANKINLSQGNVK